MLQKTSTNEFCGLCHEMQSAYLSWQDSSHFNNKQGVVADCVDCHAPADLPGYIYVKTKTGIKDVIVHNFGEPQKIDWLERRKNKNNFVYESGCLSCHKNLTESKISKVGLMAHKSYFNGETDQSCVDCHSDLAHPNRKSYENQEYKNLKKDYK